MDFRIVELAACKIAGKSIVIDVTDDDKSKKISMLWEECLADGGFMGTAKLGTIAVSLMGVVIGGDQDSFTYMIAVEDNGTVPPTYERAEIPAATYAVFESVGPIPAALVETFNKAHSEWLPSSDYVATTGPRLERYSEGDVSKVNYQSEAWIPVKKK